MALVGDEILYVTPVQSDGQLGAILEQTTTSAIAALAAGQGVIYSSHYTTLTAADAAAVVNNQQLVIDDFKYLTANTVLSAPTVQFAGGMIFHNAYTLTFNGVIVASFREQLFDVGTGVITLTKNSVVSPTWFGAASDGVTDDTAAIQAAHDSCVANQGGYVLFERGGTYKCNNSLFWDPRFVGGYGFGCTLDFSGSAPSDLGTQLITGVDSTFAGGATGTWTLSGLSASVGDNVLFTNTAAAQGYAYKAITTVPGETYTVLYTATLPVVNGPQLNVYAGTSINTGNLGYCASNSTNWFTFTASGTTTYISIRLSTSGIGDSCNFKNITVQPKQPSGVVIRDNSFAVQPSSNQFGHDAYVFEGFIIIGQGRNTGYIVDSVTPFSIYSAYTCGFGIYLDSPQINNRNSTSSRGNIKNITLRNWGAGLVFGAQCYLQFPEVIEIYNSNFGILTAQATPNAGENVSLRACTVSGCDVNLCGEGSGLDLYACSLDFPKQCQIRLSSSKPIMKFTNSHIEGSPPGQSTQLVTPIAITSDNAGLTLTNTDIMITGSMTNGSFYSFFSTTSNTQFVIFDNCQINNINTSYLTSGPGRYVVNTPSRFLAYPAIPDQYNDQGAGAATFDTYGFGDFETPQSGTGNKPQGLVAYATNVDANSYTSANYAATTLLSNASQTTTISSSFARTGTKSLAMAKLGGNARFNQVYFLAPARPGFSYRWTFWVYMPVAAAGTNCTITASQNFTTLQGVAQMWITAPGASQTPGIVVPPGSFAPLFMLGGLTGPGQQFAGNTQGGITISPTQGTVAQQPGDHTLGAWSSVTAYTTGDCVLVSNTWYRCILANTNQTPPNATYWQVMSGPAWQYFSFDLYNHGTDKCPANATHAYLKIDGVNWDGLSWGNALYIDDLQCWEL